MNSNHQVQDSQACVATLLNHRSVRRYTGEPISDEMLSTILECGRAVSTSSFFAGGERGACC